MDKVTESSDQVEITPEELQEQRDEMFNFYKESVPYLQAQKDYEQLLYELDDLRFKRYQIQIQHAMMAAPPEESAESFNKEEPSTNNKKSPEKKGSKKRRPLKTS